MHMYMINVHIGSLLTDVGSEEDIRSVKNSSVVLLYRHKVLDMGKDIHVHSCLLRFPEKGLDITTTLLFLPMSGIFDERGLLAF